MLQRLRYPKTKFLCVHHLFPTHRPCRVKRATSIKFCASDEQATTADQKYSSALKDVQYAKEAYIDATAAANTASQVAEVSEEILLLCRPCQLLILQLLVLNKQLLLTLLAKKKNLLL